jgi:hypothetical protein
MADSDYILGAFREMTTSDVQGGSASYGSVIFPCTVGVFNLENPLVAAGGGRSPRMMGVIEIASEDLSVPDWQWNGFATDQPIDVTDGNGNVRACKIDSWRNVGPLWQLTLVDLNQGA